MRVPASHLTVNLPIIYSTARLQIMVLKDTMLSYTFTKLLHHTVTVKQLLGAWSSLSQPIYQGAGLVGSSVCSVCAVTSFSSFMTLENALKFGLAASTTQGAVNGGTSQRREKTSITLQLEQHALAGRDLRTGLAHPLERPGHLLLVAARYAIREHVDVIPVLEQVQGSLQHAHVRLAIFPSQ